MSDDFPALFYYLSKPTNPEKQRRDQAVGSLGTEATRGVLEKKMRRVKAVWVTIDDASVSTLDAPRCSPNEKSDR